MKFGLRIRNKIIKDKSSVWVLPKRGHFNYADGSEKYLQCVISKAKNLSSTSNELEGWIKDWPSEYHLSKKRSNLLRGFNFDKSSKVLEVGCGCGAITRFLGENFKDVTSIEGSLLRAKIARLRTKEMKNVEILCAPFQEIEFNVKFDIIFCIGVFEYSSVFVDGNDPYDLILKYFKNVLSPDGVLVVAIENQFGLKYFSSSKEDHTGILFDGIEGYPYYGNKKARTFGYYELKKRINKHFQCIDFYYPYPDYKTPSCVLSHRFLSNFHAGELIGRIQPSSYLDDSNSRFKKKLALLELDKNKMLPFFSNSFLIIAGKCKFSIPKLEDLGIIYVDNRIDKFQTVTLLKQDDDSGISVIKKPMNGKDKVISPSLYLRKCESRWHDVLSIQTQITKRSKERNLTFEELFAPCRIWLNALKKIANQIDNELYVDGKYIDCLWTNSFIINDKCEFVDFEWEWQEKISINCLVIRCAFSYLNEIITLKKLSPTLKNHTGIYLIREIAKCIGVEINKGDFNKFCKMEAKIYEIVYGKSYLRSCISIYIVLFFSIPIIDFVSSAITFFKRKLKINLGASI